MRQVAVDGDPKIKYWQDSDEDADWTLLVLGGGAGWPTLVDSVGLTRVYQLIGPPKVARSMDGPIWADVLLQDGTIAAQFHLDDHRYSTDRIRVQGHMLVVAHGLSHRAPDLPRYEEERAPAVAKPLPAWEPPPHTVHN